MEKLTFIAFFLLIFQVGKAQTLNSKLYNYFDGMPSDNVSFVYKTQEGSLALTTQKDFLMFDGQRFFKTNETNQSIVNSFFFYQNILYYEDGQGLNKVDYYQNETVKIIRNKNFTDSNPNNDHFENLFVDSKKRIWCTDFNQIKYILDHKNVNFIVFPNNKNLNIKIHFVEISPEEIWAFTPEALYKWTEKNNSLTKVNSLVFENLGIKAVVKIDNELVIATKDKLLYVDYATLSIKKQILLPKQLNVTQLVFNNNQLFILGNHELLLLNEGVFHLVFSSDNFKLHCFLNDEITNSYWLGTSKGLLQIYLPKKGIETINLPKEFQEKDNFIIDITEEKLNQYIVLTSKNQLFRFFDGKWSLLHVFFNDNVVKTLLKHDTIYITTSKGVFWLNKNEVKLLSLKPFKANNEIVKCVVIDNELWVLYQHQQIERYNLETKQRIGVNFKNDTAFWRDNKWNDLKADVKGNVWLVGWMPKGFGICLLNKQSNVFEDVSAKKFKNHRNLFVGDYYNSIFDTKQGLLFSAYGGFNSSDYKGKLLKKIDVHHYEIDNTFLSNLSTDAYENVFFSTNAGLHIYLKNANKVVKLNITDGLPLNTLQYAFTSTSKNTLLLGVENGFVEINKKEVLKSPLVNKLAITKLLVNGKPYQFKDNNLVLEKNQNNISIYFSSFSYLENSKVFYSYTINNGEWIPLRNQTQLMFNYLPPGSYNIKIKATDFLKNEQKKQIHFYLRIKPPFTQSTLFYFLIGFVSVVIIYGLFKYSVYRKTKEKHYQLKIKDAEMRMLRAQMNPHFMFNTLNSINSYIIQNKTDDASKYLAAFSKLMRNILESSKQQFIPLEQEIKTTKLYMQLEVVRLDHSFDFKIEVYENINIQEIMIPPLIVQPFAENAIWHGLRHLPNKNGFLTIRFKLKTETLLQIDIEDNGIGREQSKF